MFDLMQLPVELQILIFYRVQHPCAKMTKDDFFANTAVHYDDRDNFSDLYFEGRTAACDRCTNRVIHESSLHRIDDFAVD